MEREKIQEYVLEKTREFIEKSSRQGAFKILSVQIANDFVAENQIVDGGEHQDACYKIVEAIRELADNGYLEIPKEFKGSRFPKFFVASKGKDLLFGATKYSKNDYAPWVSINAESVFAQFGGQNNKMTINIKDSFNSIYDGIESEEIKASVKEIESELNQSRGNKQKVLNALGNLAKLGAEKVIDKVISILIDKALGAK